MLRANRAPVTSWPVRAGASYITVYSHAESRAPPRTGWVAGVRVVAALYSMRQVVYVCVSFARSGHARRRAHSASHGDPLVEIVNHRDAPRQLRAYHLPVCADCTTGTSSCAQPVHLLLCSTNVHLKLALGPGVCVDCIEIEYGRQDFISIANGVA